MTQLRRHGLELLENGVDWIERVELMLSVVVHRDVGPQGALAGVGDQRSRQHLE